MPYRAQQLRERGGAGRARFGDRSIAVSCGLVPNAATEPTASTSRPHRRMARGNAQAPPPLCSSPREVARHANRGVHPKAISAARTSSCATRSQGGGRPTRSDIPVPRLSNRINRENEAIPRRKPGQGSQLPAVLNMGDPPRHEDDWADRSPSPDTPRHVHAVHGLRVAGLRNVHVRILPRMEPRRNRVPTGVEKEPRLSLRSPEQSDLLQHSVDVPAIGDSL